MNKVILKYGVAAFLLIINISCYADDYKILSRLTGYWKFSIGDDMIWAKPEYDDRNWDQIYVPAGWEKSGYDDYNGYAWYRKTFEISVIPDRSPVFLLLGKIDDVDEVYLNGHLIGSSGSFPPDYKTAYSENRRYIIPENLLNKNGKNVIAVRVYDSKETGGIYSGSVGIYYDADYSLLDIPLEGYWSFRIGNRREWKEPEFNDTDWDSILVPASWESQGYPDYDGYSCYRKKIIIPKKYESNPLYLSLGKIDDIDEVYFNGTFIGTVYDLKGQESYHRRGQEYKARRIYYIPDYLIKYNKQNIIAVLVYDGQISGGIYEGPIGIMSDENINRYKRKHNDPEDFWDFLYEWFTY